MLSRVVMEVSALRGMGLSMVDDIRNNPCCSTPIAEAPSPTRTQSSGNEVVSLFRWNHRHVILLRVADLCVALCALLSHMRDDGGGHMRDGGGPVKDPTEKNARSEEPSSHNANCPELVFTFLTTWTLTGLPGGLSLLPHRLYLHSPNLPAHLMLPCPAAASMTPDLPLPPTIAPRLAPNSLGLSSPADRNTPSLRRS